MGSSVRLCERWRIRAIVARRIGRGHVADAFGWTSPRIAEAFGVREDTVRLWRCDFAAGGVEALKASVASGPAPVKSEAALRVVTPLLPIFYSWSMLACANPLILFVWGERFRGIVVPRRW